MKRCSIHDALLTALAYADIFCYPLTIPELREWMPYVRKISEKDVRRTVSRLAAQKKIICVGTFVTFPGRSAGIASRIQEERIVRKKVSMGKAVSRILSFIPTVHLVGITGGVAAGSAKRNDDIDFFIVAEDGTIFITRFIVTAVVEYLFHRRHPKDKNVKDSICLNMFATTKGLAVPKKERDFFSGHEVLQMLPIFEKNNCYARFLRANRWVSQLFPGRWETVWEKARTEKQKKQVSIAWFFRLFEHIAKAVQMRYMEKRRTSEVIRPTTLRFHPIDARNSILRELGRRLMRLSIPPLDKKRIPS